MGGITLRYAPAGGAPYEHGKRAPETAINVAGLHSGRRSNEVRGQTIQSTVNLRSLVIDNRDILIAAGRRTNCVELHGNRGLHKTNRLPPIYDFDNCRSRIIQGRI